MRILVTGGLGYIGSHTSIQLISEGHEIVILDNLSNSSIKPLQRIHDITNRKPIFVEGDIRDSHLLDKLFRNFEIDAVLHFAGLKSVGESVSSPLKYYDNNVYGSQVLLSAMSSANVFNFVFSSSATIYGQQSDLPISEDCNLNPPSSPYGRSKLFVENILYDLARSSSNWKIGILRYFNPAGAHTSGLLGESPCGIPNNLLPYIAQVASGNLPYLSIFGSDYNTPDGTGVRDYVHVMDLAEGHGLVLNKLKNLNGVHIWNLGSSHGYSVFEIVRAFEKASGRSINTKLAPRRPGDLATCLANASKAECELGWKAKRGIDQMMQDTWNWHLINPLGYQD
ncbi:UDP-glucose 4-epimerase GalE [Limnobacter litoralis]|uniref:UDP-glucose 4-epimerase n=1 Tax=Limnobacter litoralis TaxID=481366 RepID=A0ABQ5YU97_9BURK|nr:UDP-glucose 4-epimerase GalE [Limnobacter litoralis]GLR27022.1 UDP-glucose 4-epimerase [Limnobacter litoralis]